MDIKTHMRDAYLGKSQETIPVGIYARYLPRGSAERAIRTSGVGIIEYFPPVSLLSPPWHILPGFLSEVKNSEFIVSTHWISGNEVQKRTFHTPVGDLSQIVERDSGGEGSEHIIKHYVTEKEDYKILQYVVEHTIFRSNQAEFLHIEKNLGSDGIILSRLDRSGYQKLLIELVGPERFLLDYYDFPDLIEELIATIDNRGDEQLKMALESGHDLIWQPDNISTDMAPPSIVEKFHLPLYKRRRKLIKDTTGGAYIIHIDGKLKHLSSLLNELEECIIESFSLPIIGGDVELDDVLKVLPAHRVFPNFPSNWASLPSDELKVMGKELYESMKNLGYPTMLQVSEDIPDYSYKKVLPIIAAIFQK